MNIQQEYADRHYTPRQQADAAWEVCNRLLKNAIKAEHLAQSCKTEAARKRNALNAAAYRHNYEAQRVRAGVLEDRALMLETTNA